MIIQIIFSAFMMPQSSNPKIMVKHGLSNPRQGKLCFLALDL